MVVERDLTLGGEHIIQYTDDMIQKHIPETDIILLTNVTQKYSIKIKRANPERKAERDSELLSSVSGV